MTTVARSNSPKNYEVRLREARTTLHTFAMPVDVIDSLGRKIRGGGAVKFVLTDAGVITIRQYEDGSVKLSVGNNSINFLSGSMTREQAVMFADTMLRIAEVSAPELGVIREAHVTPLADKFASNYRKHMLLKRKTSNVVPKLLDIEQLRAENKYATVEEVQKLKDQITGIEQLLDTRYTALSERLDALEKTEEEKPTPRKSRTRRRDIESIDAGLKGV